MTIALDGSTSNLITTGSPSSIAAALTTANAGDLYNAGVQGQVPPAVIAAKNLTTTQHPRSRPATVPGLPWKKPT